jgi:hypothetical protein
MHPNTIHSRRSGRIRSTTTLMLAALALGAVAIVSVLPGPHLDAAAPHRPPAVASTNPDSAASQAAFLSAYRVLMHPRCMNCHPSGDVPLQGENSQLHVPLVVRGPDGRGTYALKCANCHQAANVAGRNMPPGNPNWHLPHPDAPLIFQGRSPAELARQLQDPKQNGGKTLDQVLHHVMEDALVLGAWNPGEGRESPPVSHAEFVRHMREWIEKGAAIPER